MPEKEKVLLHTPEKKYTNKLIEETSPYLLQHAHNPVNWEPWSDAAFEKAKKENKLVLISIGYSACHWCHVMEHESFEDEEVAQVMNRNFINIKVDREERPDIDGIYMSAVQIMTGQGGWPLNCFVMPDGRPVYGGTYFPKNAWLDLLDALWKSWNSQPDKFREYASKLVDGIKQNEIIPIHPNPDEIQLEIGEQIIDKWKISLDYQEGGQDKAPKFPLPNNYLFLLRHGFLRKDEAILSQVKLTLKKMAYGGIYDQIEGGFSRYSVDNIWKVPHFEKMLYDNAQLMTLYSEAFTAFQDPLYKDIAYGIHRWITAEMTEETGGFFSAMDADSEGIEGKYYTWSKKELKEILGEELFEVAALFYNINPAGFWEKDQYILLRRHDDDMVAEKLNIPIPDLNKKVNAIKQALLKERSKRIKPGLDNKILLSWNAMMASGYISAYKSFREEEFKKIAIQNLRFLISNFKNPRGGFYHTNPEKGNPVNGFLEDYAFLIAALIDAYEITFDEIWLSEAENLLQYTIRHFSDENNIFFYFTEKEKSELIAHKTEVYDNVIPSSNGILATQLFKLGRILSNEAWLQRSRMMLRQIAPNMPQYPSGFSQWGILLLHMQEQFFEIAITGPEVCRVRNDLFQYYLPNTLIAGAENSSKLPLLKNRFIQRETTIFVCRNNTCNLPVNTIEEALQQIRN